MGEDKQHSQEGHGSGREPPASAETAHSGRDSTERELAALTDELHALDEDIAAARVASKAVTEPPSSFPPAGLTEAPRREPQVQSAGGERVPLRGATEVLIRTIEPEDSAALLAQLDRLSAVSRYRLFQAPVERYREDELAWLGRVDHDRNEALVALEPDSCAIVGVARYVRDPAEQTCAHFAYFVADRWEHRGVASVLIERLAARASAAGVERVRARMLVDDGAARSVLAHVAEELAEERDGNVVEITARLRASGG